MRPTASIGVVSSDPRLRFRLVQGVRPVALPLQGTARSPVEARQLLGEAEGTLILLAGATELHWIGADSTLGSTDVVLVRIAVVAHLTVGIVLAAIIGGATCVIADEDLERELPQAIGMAMAGKAWLPAELMPSLARSMATVTDSRPATSEQVGISWRESQVLELAAQGFTNREIAAHLGIAVKTVETYKHRVKLRLHGAGGRRLSAPDRTDRQSTPR